MLNRSCKCPKNMLFASTGGRSVCRCIWQPPVELGYVIFMFFQHTLSRLWGHPLRREGISSFCFSSHCSPQYGSGFIFLLVSRALNDANATRHLFAADDRLETCHCVSRLTSILQLPCDVLLRQRRQFPGKVARRPMYVSLVDVSRFH